MFKGKIVTYILLVILSFSCSNSDDNHFESYAIDLIIESSHAFKTGDAIGLFVEKRTNRDIRSTVGTGNDKTNIKWVYQEDGSWKPASFNDIIYTSIDGMPLDVYAYYPYTEQSKTDEILITSASCIMTGMALNVDNNDTQAKLTLYDKTALLKVVIPDMDILSSTQVTMIDVLNGGTIYPAELG
jgi:hypothetical protein